MKKSKDFIPQLTDLAGNQDLVHSDNLYNEVTATYAYWNTALSAKTAKRARFFKENNVPDEKGKLPSIASLQKKWDATEDGTQQILLKAEVENLKAIAKSVDNHNFTLRSEAKLSH